MRRPVLLIVTVLCLNACGGQSHACSDHAAKIAQRQTSRAFAPLPPASQTYRHGFYATALKIELLKLGCAS